MKRAQELGWVKLLHRSWTLLLDDHLQNLEIPLMSICEPLTEALDQLLMSTSIEELHVHRKDAIRALIQVQEAVSSSPLLPELEAHPDEPLTCKGGLFPTLTRILESLST